jgi:hypothetical protein
MSIKQTEIGTIHGFIIFFLPTETVIVAHPVDREGSISNFNTCFLYRKLCAIIIRLLNIKK